MRRAADRLLGLSPRRALALFVAADFLAIGMGMGVPIVCIPLGAPVGWYAAARAVRHALHAEAVLRQTLRAAVVTSGVTLLAMAVLWGRCLPLLFGPEAELVHFGVPMILYEPRASVAGWLALMILISPALQFLVTLAAGQLALLRSCRDREEGALTVRAGRPQDEAGSARMTRGVPCR